MVILFSPSEAKVSHNDSAFKLTDLPYNETLFQLRQTLFDKYKNILHSDKSNLRALSGLKKDCELDLLINTPLNQGIKALFRYSGVGYKYLSANTLNQDATNFLYKHMIIFSNLFGPIYADSIIPYYKLKQGQNLDGLNIQNHYKKLLSPLLDEVLKGKFVLDLRAGFYEKFYTPKIPYATMQFFKNGKKVSHWAKAYRGKVARALAQYQPSSQKEFEDISFEGLQIKEILHQKNATHYCFDIKDSL